MFNAGEGLTDAEGEIDALTEELWLTELLGLTLTDELELGETLAETEADGD